MNLRQLRFVKALAATRSFSRAAERCAVTQPTLSNAVAQLERELGAPLFERTTRKVVPTPFGRHLLPLVEDVLSATDELARGAHAYLHPEHRLVRLGMSPLVNVHLLSCVLEPFERGHGDVKFIYKECFLDDLEERLARGKIDFGIRPAVAARPAAAGLESMAFYEEQLCFLAPSLQPGEAPPQGALRLTEVAGQTFVLTPDVCGLTALVTELFHSHGHSLKAYPGQALTYRVMEDWAELGIGAAILPESKITRTGGSAPARLLRDDGRPAEARFEIVWRRNAALPDQVAACRDHFRTVMPGLVAGLAA